MTTTNYFELSPNRKIEYQLSENPERETIVFVHGLSANLKQFAKQHEDFNEEYQVLSLSLPGHGGSKIKDEVIDKELSLENLEAIVLELFDHLGVGRVHFVGNSAGGLVGLQILKDYPQRLLSLTTFGTTPKLQSPWLLEKSMLLMINLLGMKGMANLARKTSSKELCVNDLVAEMMTEADKDSVLAFTKAIASYDYLDVLLSTEVPYLLIRGELDADINRNLDKLMVNLLERENFVLEVFKDTGHFLNLEKRQEFLQTLLKFLKNED